MVKKNLFIKLCILFIALFTAVIILAYLFLGKNELLKTITLFPNYNPLKEEVLSADLDTKNFQNTSKTSQNYNQNGQNQKVEIKDIVIENRIIKFKLPLSSGEVRENMLYMPPTYNPSKKYKLVFLLYGSQGVPSDWFDIVKINERVDKFNTTGKFLDTIFVMPNGFGDREKDNQYIDTEDNRQKNMKYISEDIPKYLKNKFNISSSSKDITIGGVSAGAFGALNIGLKNPQTFGNIFMISGYGNIEINETTKDLLKNKTNLFDQNSPLKYLGNLPKSDQNFYFVVGKQDELFRENVQLYEAMKKKGFNVTLKNPDGNHLWADFLKWVDDVLVWIP